VGDGGGARVDQFEVASTQILFHQLDDDSLLFTIEARILLLLGNVLC
jgi:hypothetical protein